MSGCLLQLSDIGKSPVTEQGEQVIGAGKKGYQFLSYAITREVQMISN